MVSEWHSGREFDAILLDAPCTASGIVRRQPDVPWSRRPEDPARLAREQARLLNALWPLVKKGGRLLYCTCSIFPEEGPDQIRRFTANHGDAQLTAFKGAPTGMMSLVPADHVHELPLTQTQLNRSCTTVFLRPPNKALKNAFISCSLEASSVTLPNSRRSF